MNWLKSKNTDSYINKISYITGTKSGRKNENTENIYITLY